MHAKKTFRKIFVCVQNSICSWKKTKKKIGANSENYLKKFLCRQQKNASHTISIYGNCIWKLYGKLFFFKKKFLISFFFCHQSVQLISKSRRNGLIVFSIVFRKCMKLHDKHFLHTLDVWICIVMIFVVWNCMISIFGVWRSTRVVDFELAINLNLTALNILIF